MEIRSAHRRASTKWNIDREDHLAQLSDNGYVKHPDVLLETWDVKPPEQGTGKVMISQVVWYRISRHAAGTGSAYVVQHKLRKQWPNLLFKVVNTTTDDRKPWNAEIWARRVVT